MVKNTKTNLLASIVSMLLVSAPAMASEADLVVPEIAKHYPLGHNLLLIGIAVSVLGLIFGLIAFAQVKKSKYTNVWQMLVTQFLKHVKLT